MTLTSRATLKLAEDAVVAAGSILKDGEELTPLLIVEVGGVRDFEHFDRGEIQTARSRASQLSRPTAGDRLCALVYEGRAKLDRRAILVEIQRAGEAELEVFCQPFRPRSGRFRPFKLIGEVELAGFREALG